MLILCLETRWRFLRVESIQVNLIFGLRLNDQGPLQDLHSLLLGYAVAEGLNYLHLFFRSPNELGLLGRGILWFVLPVYPKHRLHHLNEQCLLFIWRRSLVIHHLLRLPFNLRFFVRSFLGSVFRTYGLGLWVAVFVMRLLTTRIVVAIWVAVKGSVLHVGRIDWNGTDHGVMAAPISFFWLLHWSLLYALDWKIFAVQHVLLVYCWSTLASEHPISSLACVNHALFWFFCHSVILLLQCFFLLLFFCLVRAWTIQKPRGFQIWAKSDATTW